MDEQRDFLFNTNQLFECRDCPARCCKMPWKITIPEEEKLRYESELEWTQQRLREKKAAFREAENGEYMLPMQINKGRVACAFLEEDDLCGIQRRYGHERIPVTCQYYPFGFFQDANGTLRVVTSKLCPSIRDNYGAPIMLNIGEKFLQSGGEAYSLTEWMTLSSTTVLTQPQYLLLAEVWEELLQEEKSVGQALMACYDITSALAARFQGYEVVEDEAWAVALEEESRMVRERRPELAGFFGKRAHLYHRWESRFALYIATYRTVIPDTVLETFTPAEQRRFYFCYGSLLFQLVFRVGRIHCLFSEKPVPLRAVGKVRGILVHSQSQSLLRRYLCEVIHSGCLFASNRQLLVSLFNLGMAYALTGFFSRMQAAREGRKEASVTDLRDGVSAAEFALTCHGEYIGEPETGRDFFHALLREEGAEVS